MTDNRMDIFSKLCNLVILYFIGVSSTDMFTVLKSKTVIKTNPVNDNIVSPQNRSLKHIFLFVLFFFE